MPRPYEPDLIVRLCEDVSQLKDLRDIVRGQLRQGVHPYYLGQSIRLIDLDLSGIEQRTFHKIVDPVLPISTEKLSQGNPAGPKLFSPLSKIQDLAVPEGIVHGILVETLVDMLIWHREDPALAQKTWLRERDEFVKEVLSLPNVNFRIVDTTIWVAQYLNHSFGSSIGLELPGGKAIDNFIEAMMSRQDFPSFIRNFLAGWSDGARLRSWKMIIPILGHLEKQGRKTIGIKLVETLLAIKPQEGHLYHAAGQVLRGSEEAGEAFDSAVSVGDFSLSVLIQFFGQEIRLKRARRVLIRWLQRAPESTQIKIMMGLACKMGETCTINEEAENLIEEIVGPEGWVTICNQQTRLDAKTRTKAIVGHLPTAETQQQPGLQVIGKSLRASGLNRHDSNLAEMVESVIENSGLSDKTVAHVLEESLDILSGDLVVTVSHLRDEWMQVRRRSIEVFGVTIPRIDLARHRRHGDIGAACNFRIPLSSDSKQVLRGSLDAEGELTLENAPLLEQSAQRAIRAAVTQTLCAVLIPTLIEEVPSRLESSGPSIITGEPWASRPIIHTLGQIGNMDNGDDSEVHGSRLNPNIAMLLFGWLLGAEPTETFRLFIETETTKTIGGKKEKYFASRKGARELLRKRQLRLSQVYVRAVRAHTRPLSAYLDDDGAVRVKQMSSKAERNYQRYRNDGGRELDFSEVQKTYIFPHGLRVPLKVPRTFSNGCFVSLDDALRLIFDPDFKNAILKAFLI